MTGNMGKRTISLSFSITPAVKSKVLKGKLLLLLLLLPRFEVKSQELSQLANEDGTVRLKVANGHKDQRLGKQTLDLTQMVLALLKFKDIISQDFPERVKEIDMYIRNIVMIKNKYTGLAYGFYHLYFRDKATQLSERGEVLDWFVLDMESLHVAIVSNTSANVCEHCQSWYHSSSKCPFNLRSDMVTCTWVSQKTLIYQDKDKGKRYSKSKEICAKYSYFVCSGNSCNILFICRFWNKFDHPIMSGLTVELMSISY